MPLEKCSFLLDVTEIPNSSELKVENAQKKLTHARKEIVSLETRLLKQLSVQVNEKERKEVLKKTKKLNKRKREEEIAEKILNQKRKKQKICELNPLQSISLEQWKKLVPIVLPRLFVPHTQRACSCHKMHCVIMACTQWKGGHPTKNFHYFLLKIDSKLSENVLYM